MKNVLYIMAVLIFTTHSAYSFYPYEQSHQPNTFKNQLKNEISTTHIKLAKGQYCMIDEVHVRCSLTKK